MKNRAKLTLKIAILSLLVYGFCVLFHDLYDQYRISQLDILPQEDILNIVRIQATLNSMALVSGAVGACSLIVFLYSLVASRLQKAT